MRNAALMLGVIGGIVGMIIGFFSYGYTELVDWASSELGEDKPEILKQVENVWLIRSVSLLAPLLAIGGGAMAHARPMIAGLMLIVASGGMYYAFGFNVFTMFPIAMCALGGILALVAKEPDPR